MGKHYSTKHYGHNIGLSAVFRQPNADHSHCHLLHGYSLAFTFTFGCDELDNKNELSKNILDKIKSILKDADIIIFMLDARTGIMPFDYSCADILRKVQCPILLVVNKVESETQKNQAYEALKLGYGEPLIISAEHGIGLGSLEENLSILMKKIN